MGGLGMLVVMVGMGAFTSHLVRQQRMEQQALESIAEPSDRLHWSFTYWPDEPVALSVVLAVTMKLPAGSCFVRIVVGLDDVPLLMSWLV